MSSRREELTESLNKVREEIASFAPTLIVVTKTYPLSDVEILSSLGVENFGENRNEEGLVKASSNSGRWHFQGELQSQKIRSILSWADCIHSLDSLSHGQKISRILSESGESREIFLQFSLDGDPTRGGVNEEDLFQLATELSSLSGLAIKGVMAVPPISMETSEAYSIIARVHQRFSAEFPEATSLSAGMSEDYMVALNHGATHIRVGSKILGKRQAH